MVRNGAQPSRAAIRAPRPAPTGGSLYSKRILAPIRATIVVL